MLTKPRSESSSNETTVLLPSWVSLENPGDPYKTWDASVAADYMPSQYFTYRLEYNHRAANVPYFSGPGGVTPPGSNTGAPGSVVPGWSSDLRNSENRITGAFLVKS
ncbi:MAG: hypothetical protein JWQ42_1565 [Edaphobacter sp.]|nr:hypothetical protein [Edaphobacter sp.]